MTITYYCVAGCMSQQAAEQLGALDDPAVDCGKQPPLSPFGRDALNFFAGPTGTAALAAAALLAIFLDAPSSSLPTTTSAPLPPLARAAHMAAIVVALGVQTAEVAAMWAYLPGYSGSGWAVSDGVTTASLLLDLLPGIPLTRARAPLTTHAGVPCARMPELRDG